jgi:hypothetical protein
MADINEIVSPQAIGGLKDVINALGIINEQLKEAKKYDAVLSGIAKSQGDAASKAKDLGTAQKAQEDSLKSLNKQREQAEKQIQKNLQKEAEYEAALRNEAKTMDEVRKQNKALIAEREKVNTKTDEGRKKIAELNKQIDANNKTLKENSSQLEKQKINVGNYISSWGPFQGVANAVTKGIAIMKIAFASLKAAIISTGIGALVVAVASLATFFSKTERGADALRKILAGFNAVVSVLIDRVIAFGEGLFKIFSGDFRAGLDQIGNSFKGITSEIREEYELARKLADELDRINDARRAGNVEQARLRKEVTELLEIARSEEYTTEQRLTAWQKANKLSRENIAITRHLNEMEMANLKARLDMGENTEKQYDDIAALQAKMYDDESRAQGEINSLIKLGNKLRRESAEEQQRAARAANDIKEIETLAFTGFEKQKTQAVLDNLQLRDEAETDFFNKNMARIESERQARAQAAQQYIDLAANVGNTILQINQMALDNEIIAFQNAKAYELQLAGDNAAQQDAINAKYAKKEKELKQKQAKQNKAVAIFNAIIGTAQAVISGLMTQPFLPLGIIMGALAGALGAVQIGLIASQPIPQFAKGTRSAPRGLAMVGERGRELILGANGDVALTGDGAHLAYLSGGQQIIPNAETERILAAARGGFDSRELRVMMHQNERHHQRLIDTIKNKREIYIDAAGQRITERKGGYFKNYYNKKIIN